MMDAFSLLHDPSELTSAVQLFTTLAMLTGTLSTVLTARAQQSFTVTYDTEYDNASTPLSALACAQSFTEPGGFHGVDYVDLGSLPDFPFLGGSSVVAGFDMTNCVSCWVLKYEGANVTVLVVDTAQNGFAISEEAMNVLTDGQAADVGSITAETMRVDVSQCGL